MGMIRLCLFSLKERKGRTALIALSIAIGVLSVLVIGIISDNGVTLINGELDTLGICGVSVTKTSAEANEMLTNEDLEKIKKQAFVDNATPILTANGYFKDDALGGAAVCGIDENARSVISVETVKGEKITKTDIVSKSMVCLIDEKNAEKLFGEKSPIGKEIDIFLCGTAARFKVKGIVKASSSILQTSVGDLLPNIVYVPFTTLQFLMGTKNVDQIAVNFSDKYDNDGCIERLKKLVGENQVYSANVEVEDLNKQRDSLNGVLNIITAVLSLIGGVSLIVSGLGIMTIMLVTVNEKTKEIGIKKSIGAKSRDIVFEFLFESGIISVLGSILGVLLTLLLSIAAKMILDINIEVNPVTVIKTVGVAVLCGVIFGVYPALKASRLKPIDALRCE